MPGLCESESGHAPPFPIVYCLLNQASELPLFIWLNRRYLRGPTARYFARRSGGPAYSPDDDVSGNVSTCIIKVDWFNVLNDNSCTQVEN